MRSYWLAKFCCCARQLPSAGAACNPCNVMQHEGPMSRGGVRHGNRI
jgi:hypothetical protein